MLLNSYYLDVFHRVLIDETQKLKFSFIMTHKSIIDLQIKFVNMFTTILMINKFVDLHDVLHIL